MYSESIMTEQCNLQSNGLDGWFGSGLAMETGNAPSCFASPSRRQIASESDLLVSTPAHVFLNLEDLKCFEAIDLQYQRWGIIFHNCIAIHPSNPAFPARSGATVLMGSPKAGWLEATFVHPVCFVKVYVTTSQRMVMTAYDKDNQQLTQVEVTEPNLDGSGSKIAPNTPLSIAIPNIHRITFSAFDGQFTIDDISYQL